MVAFENGYGKERFTAGRACDNFCGARNQISSAKEGTPMLHAEARSRRRAVVLALGGTAALLMNVDWPSYNADTMGSRYRPLDQINAGNFSQLEIAWRFK